MIAKLTPFEYHIVNIEFDSYKQKLNEVKPTLEALADSLNIEGLRNELERLQAMQEKQMEILKQQQEEIIRLQNISRPVEDAVIEVINEQLDKRFATLLQNTLTHAAKALTVDCVDNTPDESNVYSGICFSLYEMIFAEIFASYYTLDAKEGKYRFTDVDDYLHKAEDFKVDLKATIAAYITSINNCACIDGETEKKSILRNLLDKDK